MLRLLIAVSWKGISTCRRIAVNIQLLLDPWHSQPGPEVRQTEAIHVQRRIE